MAFCRPAASEPAEAELSPSLLAPAADDDDDDEDDDDNDDDDDERDGDDDLIGPATPPSPLLAQPGPSVRSGG